MLKRFPIVLACAVAVASAATAGAAAQGDYGHGSHASAPGVQRPAKKWKQFRQLGPSRLSQSAYLTGVAEVDAQGDDDAGDPDGKGSATFLQVDERTICYGFTARGLDSPMVVHIHKGVVGQNGPPVIGFNNVPKDATGVPSGDPGASAGCKTVTDPSELDALRRIRKNPHNYYVNIHTASFPNGAIRGQLSPVWYDNQD